MFSRLNELRTAEFAEVEKSSWEARMEGLTSPVRGEGASGGSAGVIGSKAPGQTSVPSTPTWGQVAIGAQRKPVGSNAIGSQRSVSGAASPTVNTQIASGNDWFPPLMGKIGGGPPGASAGQHGSDASNGGKGYPGLDRRAVGSGMPGQDYGEAPSRSASTTGLSTIGSERRQASEAQSVLSSRAASPTNSSSLHQSPTTLTSPQSLQHQPPSAISIAPPPNDTPVAQHQQLPANGSNQQQQQQSGSSTSSELESAFDAMLRGSSAFQAVINRLSTLELQVQSMTGHSGPNGHFDVTPTRSPSVVPSSNYLTAQSGGHSRPHSLLIPQANTASPSVVSTALHSPVLSQGGQSDMPGFNTLSNAANTSADRDTIRQLSAQLSALGSNVAQLMAQQPMPTSANNSMSSAPASATSAHGPWSSGHEYGHPAQHGPVHGNPNHPMGRPNLSNLRASSYDIPRGAVMPRGSAAAAAAYNEEREARKRSQMTLQAPQPMGMGSRRHSADIVENMHNVAEGMPGAGPQGPGNQSLQGKWEALGVSGELLRAIIKYGIGPPSKIQMKAIPCVLNTQDIVAQASSIQERIQSYVIPALQHVYNNNMAQANSGNMSDSVELPAPIKGVQALILTATIDQAGQAHRMCLGLGQSLGISSSLAVGQGDVTNELNALTAKPPQILVGTPQKLLDLLSIRSIPTDRLSLLVIDEMDQLIARNLSDFVNNLAKLLPPPIAAATSSKSPGGQPVRAQERQTAIFSCTV